MLPWPAPTWPPPPNYLPRKEPATSRRFSVTLCPPDVVPTYVSLSAAPSGAGELSLALLAINRNVATFTAYGGVPGRVYTLVALAADVNNATYQNLTFLPIADTLAVDPPPVPPSAGFGPAITWGTAVVQYTPVAVTGNLVLTTANAPQELVPFVINGGFLYNPSLAAYQGIPVAESIWYDLTGAPAQVGAGGTSLELQPGSLLNLFGMTTSISWVAATALHKISAVVW